MEMVALKMTSVESIKALYRVQESPDNRGGGGGGGQWGGQHQYLNQPPS